MGLQKFKLPFRIADDGVSLVELLIYMGVASALALGTATLMVNNQESTKKLRISQTRDSLAQQLYRIAISAQAMNKAMLAPTGTRLNRCIRAAPDGPGNCRETPGGSTTPIDHPLTLVDPLTSATLSGPPGAANRKYYNDAGAPCTAASSACPIYAETFFQIVCPSYDPQPCDAAETIRIFITVGYDSNQNTEWGRFQAVAMGPISHSGYAIIEGDGIGGEDIWTNDAGVVYLTNTANHVGIGTTNSVSNDQSWDKVLDVFGRRHSKILARESTGNAIVGMYAHNSWGGEATGTIGTETDDPLRFVTNYRERMRLSTDGRLGIAPPDTWSAASPPAAHLHIKTTEPTFRLQDNDGTGVDRAWQLHVGNTGGNLHFLDVTGGTEPFVLSYGAPTNSLRIAQDGDVGVGTDTPQMKLDTRGNFGILHQAGWSGTLYGSGSAGGWGQFIEMGAGLNWMGTLPDFNGRYGINVAWNSDYAFFGLQDTAGNDRKDLVIQWEQSADDLHMQVADVKRVTVKGTGGVGIETTNPTALLEIQGATSSSRLKIGDLNGSGNLDDAHHITSFRDMVFNAAGSAAAGPTAGGGTNATAFIWRRLSSYDDLGSPTNPYNTLMNLDTQGDLWVGGCIYTGGSHVPGAPCNSDRRLKKNIQPYKRGLEEVLKIAPVTYGFNGLGNTVNDPDDKKRLGVIAQQLEEIAPEMVTTRKMKLRAADKHETDVKAVDYGSFTYMLINAVKELHAMITDLFTSDEVQSEKIAELEAKVKEQDEEIQSLKADIAEIKRALAGER